MNTKKRLFTNSFSGVVQVILTVFLTFASIPIFIEKLGLDLYGVFSLISIIGNLNTLANFGLNGALLIYLAKQGKCMESNYDIVVTYIFMIVIISVFSVIAISLRGIIVNQVFAIPLAYYNESKLLLIYMVLSNALLLLGQVSTTIIDSQQKIFFSNISQFFYSLLYWGSLVCIVSLGGNLAQIGIGAFIAAFLWFLLVTIIAKKVWGSLKLQWLLSRFLASLRKQLSYGSKIYASGLIAFFFEPISKLLLSHFVGVRSAGLFDIGLRVKVQLNSIITKSLYPFFPFIASSYDSEILRYRIYDMSKKIQLFVIPISVILFYCLPIIMKLWLGKEVLEDATEFVRVITVSMLLFSPAMIPIYQFLLAKKHANKTIIIMLSMVVSNAIIFYLLYSFVGSYAILFANSIALLVSFVLLNYYQIVYLEIKWQNVIAYQIKLAFMLLVMSILCFIFYVSKSLSLLDLLIYPTLVYFIFVIFNKKYLFFTSLDAKIYLSTVGIADRIVRKLLFL